MGYSDFDLKKVVRTFGLTDDVGTDLFADIEPVGPSDLLRRHLEELTPLALGISTAAARREFLVSPILLDARRRCRAKVTVLPGIPLDIDEPAGLMGTCDYVLARSSRLYYLESPVATVAVDGSEDYIAKLGACAAAMVAIRVFNEREGSPMPAVYGAVTCGSIWRFLKLEGELLFIDRAQYFLSNLAKILGILVRIADEGFVAAPA